MDLASQIALVEAVERKDEKSEGIETLFVAPSPETVPDDGVLGYVTMESVYDLGSAEPGSVMLVRPPLHSILRIVAENPVAFGRRLIVLSGLPGAEYTSTFDGATWNCDRVSYAALLADLNDARVRAEVEAAANETRVERERKGYTRADGSVKAHDALVFKTDSDAGDGVEDD